MSKFSQRTLGLLRDILTDMEPKKVRSTFELNEFWKNRLFDFGIPNDAISIMLSHDFRWSNIIPSLHEGTLGHNYSYFQGGLSFGDHEDILRGLIVFVMTESGSARIHELRQALAADGFDLPVNPEVDSRIPEELRHLPGPDIMRADLSERLKSGQLVALLFLDLDNFKNVNDKLGSHAEGDECLIRVVKTMGAAVVHKGKLYRRSGDEFIVVLPNFDAREATAVAERIRAAIDEAKPGGSVRVTASIGVATSESGDVTDAASLEKRADNKMYEAKKTRNRVVS